MSIIRRRPSWDGSGEPTGAIVDLAVPVPRRRPMMLSEPLMGLARVPLILGAGIVGAVLGAGFTLLCVVALVPPDHPPVLSWPALAWAAVCSGVGSMVVVWSCTRKDA